MKGSKSLDRQFAEFLKAKQGDATYAAFARKIGMTASSLHRLRNGQQSATLRVVQQVTERLKIGVGDVFK